MKSIPTIIKPDEKLVSNPGYTQFVESLNALYRLRELEPSEFKFVEIDMGSGDLQTPPRVMVDVAKDHPRLAIGLDPMYQGKPVAGSKNYQSPMLLKAVDRWGNAADHLGKYQIKGMLGVPESKEWFDKPVTLMQHFENNTDFKISDSTAVVEVAGLLPYATDGSFETEFNPQIWIQPGGHSYYLVGYVMEDQIGYIAHMTQGKSRTDIKSILENDDCLNWAAD